MEKGNISKLLNQPKYPLNSKHEIVSNRLRILNNIKYFNHKDLKSSYNSFDPIRNMIRVYPVDKRQINKG